MVVKDNQVDIKLEGAVCISSRDVFIESKFGVGEYTVFVGLLRLGSD